MMSMAAPPSLFDDDRLLIRALFHNPLPLLLTGAILFFQLLEARAHAVEQHFAAKLHSDLGWNTVHRGNQHRLDAFIRARFIAHLVGEVTGKRRNKTVG